MSSLANYEKSFLWKNLIVLCLAEDMKAIT